MIDIEVKEDSAEKLVAVAGKPTKYYLFAAEFNSLKNGINSLASSSVFSEFLVINGFSILGQDITFPADWEWRLNWIEYTNPLDIVITIPLASAGMQRMDRFVVDVNNTFVRVPGTESSSNPILPSQPANTLDVTYVLVGDSTIGEPILAFTGNEFVKKIENQESTSVGTGVISALMFNTEVSSVRFINTATEVKSVNAMTGYSIYSGKELTLKNFQSIPLIIRHLSSTGSGTHKFFFANGLDYVMQPGEIIQFSATNTNGGRYEALTPVNVNQVKLTTSTSITTLTKGSVNNLSQHGKNVILDNGANSINLTTDINSESDFVASYLKHGSSAITFVAGSGTTLIQVDGTAILNGALGSTATLSRVNNSFYLRINNV